MTKQKIATGTCLCKAVTVTFPFQKETFDACHCGMCRNWGGGPALTVDGGTSVTFEGQEFITVYSSSDWAERGFCKRCGTHLFYRLKESGFHNFPLGLVSETDHLKFHTEIFIDMKPNSYSFCR
jgi:hypothetical protein